MAKRSSGSYRRERRVRTTAGATTPRLSEEGLKRADERIAAIPDDQIDFSDIPALTDADFERMVPGQLLMYRPRKKPVTMRLDVDVLEWLKSTGPGYQSLANRLLRYQMCLAVTRAADSKRSSKKAAATNGSTKRNGNRRRA